MSFTFSGGLHVCEHKETSNMPIEIMKAPEKVAIPLVQHIGAPVAPVVSPGDKVKKGQVIGRADDVLSCPVHSSVSGVVSGIEERIVGASRVNHIIIENDRRDDECLYKPCTAPYSLYEVINAVREAGISGMGGATFPTYAKIQSAATKAKTLIVNCAECEPYITANHRLMLESPDEVIGGAEILAEVLNIENTVFAIEDNKPDAIELFGEKLSEKEKYSVAVMKTKYPQGDERQLIYALYKKQLPSGKLPADIGFVVFNTETCRAIYRAVTLGEPLISRVVTVAGECLKSPKNLRIPLGTSIRDVIEYCGGKVCEPDRIVVGGPMMGVTVWDIDTTITKGTSAILLLRDEKKFEGSCIHCGRCVSVCPMHLMPNYISLFFANSQFDKCEKYNCMSCVECGCCTYVCPAGIPIVQYIRRAKGEIVAARKKVLK